MYVCCVERGTGVVWADGWKQGTCKRHKGFTGDGAGAENLWLGISMLLNVRCVRADLRDGHGVLLVCWEQGRLWPWLWRCPSTLFWLGVVSLALIGWNSSQVWWGGERQGTDTLCSPPYFSSAATEEKLQGTVLKIQTCKRQSA